MLQHVTAPDEPRDDSPRWASTAGRTTISKRLAAGSTRLFRSARRPRHRTGADPNSRRAATSSRASQQALREYQAANLATARTGSEELVRAGFNTGHVPYGYRAHRVRVTPAGRRPRWRTRLTIEPVEASTVHMIFAWRGKDRLSTSEIHSLLAASRYPAPLDHHTGQPSEWTLAVIHSILSNPKYLGRQVWGRQYHGQPVPAERWVWSDPWAHPPIVDEGIFTAAQLPHRGADDTAQRASSEPQGWAA